MNAIAPVATPHAAAEGSTGKDNSTITANDFMTLLVTEMKNQDPTSPTDPSQYMQQLVSVNSLQQLIIISQELAAGNTSATN